MTLPPLGDRELAQTWESAWGHLGVPAPVELREELERAWSEPQRYYHDQRHLRGCLALWTIWSGECEHPGEVGLALWFHDAVYDPQASDNELNSAIWAKRSLEAAGVERDVVRRVHELIMATCHGGGEASQPRSPGDHATIGSAADRSLLLDIDLAILGSPPERFNIYEQDVRREYAWVPLPVYREKRAALLKMFLNSERLYRSAPAFERFESQARINLTEAISKLT